MKILTNITRYRCEFCKKEYQVGAACKKHEMACSKNPENNIACSWCIHLKEVSKIVDTGDSYNPERTVKSFHCEKKGIDMYPPKCVHKGYVSAHPEMFDGEELMPKECELHDLGFGI